MRTIALLSLFLILAHPPVFCAEIFKYKNDQGQTNYVDDVSKIPQKYRSQSKSVASYEIKPDAPAVHAAKVEIFSTSWCGYCRQLKAF